MQKQKCPYIKGKKALRAKMLSDTLKDLYPDAPCALSYNGNPFHLLVMARLSAQCTDKRVNEVSLPLFHAFPTPEAMAHADLSEIEKIIRPCGLYHTKAESIKKMSQELIERHNGQVPHTFDELIALSGIGMKIANLILGDIFSKPAIVPDTHCIRISYKTGLISKPEPQRCQKELDALIKKEEQSDFCHRIVMFGRAFCKAPRPLCELCPIKEKFKEN